MLWWLFRLFKGYVRIHIKSISPEYFLERCRINGIFIWELVCLDKGQYQCCLFLKDVFCLKNCVRGAGVRLRICERRGLPFFLRRNQKRWYAAAGFFSFFLLLYIMSLFLWDIHFQGNYHYSADTLVRYLDTQNIKYGMKKKNVDCEALEAGMREAFPQITWVSARVSGTRLLIQIKENKIIQDKTAVEEEACDLVSNVSGTITYIMVRQGVPKVKKGEKIEPGQILVSGRVPVIGDDEKEVSVFYVQSQGEILAETGKTYVKEMPLIRKVRYPAGKKRYGLRLIIGPFSFSFLMPRSGKSENKENWDYTVDMIQCRLFSSFYLPLFVGKITGEYMTVYEKGYTEAELEQTASETNRQFVEKLKEKGVQILENNDKIEKNISGYRISGKLTVIEPAAVRAPVSESSISAAH